MDWVSVDIVNYAKSDETGGVSTVWVAVVVQCCRGDVNIGGEVVDGVRVVSPIL